MNQSVEVTPAEQLAALVSGNAKHTISAVQRAVSARINLHTLARVDAMAAKAGKSRNDMLNLMLDVAADEIYRAVDEKVLQDLQSREIVTLDQE